MNDCVLKGPDRFVNNLLAVVIGFRNGRVGAAADIKKFHNQVYLIEKDIHMQRYLWRGMDKNALPQTYAVRVNNFGVKPANCIATCALHKSADSFAELYPLESKEIKDQTYIDDELVAAVDRKAVLLKTCRMDEIAEHAGMPNKGWTFSYDESSSDVSIGSEAGDSEERVLGLLWVPSADTFNFRVILKLKTESGELKITSCERMTVQRL